MRVGWQKLLIAAGVAALAASSLLAQGQRDRDRTFEASEKLAAELRKARIHWGPLYLLSYITFSDLGYDQTFFLPTNDQASGLSLAISAPQRLYFVPYKKTIYSLEATPSVAFFSGHGNHTQFGYLLRGDAHFLTNFVYADVFALTSNQLHAQTGEVNRIVTERQRSGGVTGEARYSTKTKLVYTAVERRYDYPSGRYQPSDISIALLDRTERDYRLSLRHRTFPLTTLTLAGEYGTVELPNADQKSGHRTFFGPGFMFDNGETNMTFEIGQGKVVYRDPNVKGFSGIVGSYVMTHRIGPKTSWNLDASRDTDISIFANNNYYVADRAAIGIQYQATRRLQLLAGSTYGRDHYDVPTDIAGIGTVRRDDKITFTSVGWRYTLRHLRGGFDIGYYRRVSNTDIDQANGIRLLLQLSLSP